MQTFAHLLNPFGLFGRQIISLTNIIFKIMAEIKNSRFVIADVTGQKNGVYFEGGHALGLGLPVIWSVRKDDADNIHFDTAQYNQIRWETPEELQEGLFDFICAIIGQRN